MKDGHCVIILHGHHYRKAVELLKAERQLPWTNDSLPMLQMMRGDGKRIKQAEVIKLKKTSNLMATFVRMETSFVDILNALINCASAFELAVRGESFERTY